MPVYTAIESVIEGLNIETITQERKETLQPLIDFIREKVANKEEIRLNFICTHNSRRSHLSQIWAQTIAAYLGVREVFCYSGGTEATAMYPMVVETLKKSGFLITTIAASTNPIYAIKYTENAHPIIGFSKEYGATFNPQSAFAAIMTCSQADGGCPFIAGAEKRIPITYEDPKAFDGTPEQADKYEERSLQIATELLYVFTKAIES